MALGRILIAWLIHAVALLSLPYLMDSIQVDNFYSALLAAILLGLVNALVKPLFVLLTLPITMLTMGLFIFVINGLMLWGVSEVVHGFQVAGFWSAVGGAFLMNIIANALMVIVSHYVYENK